MNFYSYFFFSFFHSCCNRERTKLNMQKVKFYLNIHVLSIILFCLLLRNKLESLERVLFSSLISMFLVILIFWPSQYSAYNCIVVVWISYISAWMHQNFPYNVYWILRENLYHDYNVVMSNMVHQIFHIFKVNF